MDSELLSKIHQAVKADNVKEFDQLITQRLLSLCLGRFPLLSLCYLYQSTIILAKYEKQLQAITSQNYFTEIEPTAIYQDFRTVAGKSLRLFTNSDTVSPAEMLAILGYSEKLNYEWKNLEKNALIISNVKKIYQINYQHECIATTESINAPKVKGKNNSSNILFKFAIIALCFVFLFSSIFGVTIGVLGTGKVFAPLKVYSANVLQKNATASVILEKDLDLSGMHFDKIGSLNGNNKKITVDNLDFFGTIVGELSNVTIEINLDIDVSQIETALIKENNGTIDNVRIIVNGTINEYDTENDLLISALVGTNNGTIKNTQIQGDISLYGNAKGNATYSAFASVNNGTISNCKLYDGSIKSENVDLAGFVVTNNGNIENVENYQTIYQKGIGELDKNYAWNPNCTGIAITNYGNVENARNYGKIEATSETEKVYQIIISGIVVNNYGNVNNALNSGELSATSLNCSVLVGGITAFNYATYSDLDKLVTFATLKECSNSGNITLANSGNETSELISGGIASLNQGNIIKCDNFGYLKTSTKSAYAYSAGIVAINTPFAYNEMSAYSTVSECKSETEIIADIGDKMGLFGGLVARNESYLRSSFAFNKFSITAPPQDTPTDENENEENTMTLPPYFVGTVSGFAFLSINIFSGYISTTDNNYGYYENAEIAPIGAFVYNNSIMNNVNDTLNFGFTDKELMIATLKNEGLYR